MALLLAHGFSVPAHRRRVLAPAAEVAAPVATRLVAKRWRQRQLRPALSAGDISRHSTTYIYGSQHCICIRIYIDIRDLTWEITLLVYLLTMHGGQETSDEKNGDQERGRCNTVVAAAGVLHFELTVSAAFLGALFLIISWLRLTQSLYIEAIPWLYTPVWGTYYGIKYSAAELSKI